jgi:hypothetical protein
VASDAGAILTTGGEAVERYYVEHPELVAQRTERSPASSSRHAHGWKLFEDTPVPDDQVLCPGMIEAPAIANGIVYVANVAGKVFALG